MIDAKVRDAVPSDWPAIARLLEATALPLTGAREHLTGFVVAERGDRVVATAGLEIYGHDALLRSVAVDPSERGAGLGRAVVDAALARARDRGIDTVALLTTGAGDWFPRFGFERVPAEAVPSAVKESSQFKGVCPSTATAMCCRLTRSISPKERAVSEQAIKDVVRAKYGEAARRAASGKSNSCCGGAEGSCGSADPITANLYDLAQQSELPSTAVLASLGCGNPTALAELRAGETVLDLGSGGGIDVLLSAKRVGPTGKAYGLDMTDDMLALARENQRKSGLTNVEFLKGEIENIPLPDDSVDVIISNCVINLSADKDRVLREAFRVLKPGGRFAVSDVVVRGEIPTDIRRSVELWVGCIAGAMEEGEYRARLERAGFVGAELEPTRIYRIEDAKEFLTAEGIDVEKIAPLVDGKFMSAFVRATKPAPAGAGASATKSEAACCSPGCCGG